MSHSPIVTVTLNPAIDQTLSISGFATGKVNRVSHMESHAAGKGVNVAVTLADLGAATIATGWLGDQNQDIFKHLFATKRIDDRFIRAFGETRVGIKISDEKSGDTTDINFPGLTPSIDDLKLLLNQIDTLAAKGRWFALCGSVPAGVSDDIYAQLIDRISAGGGNVVLDTSGKPLHEALTRGPAVAKPNIAELSELAGRPLNTANDVVTAARSHLLERGVKLAVVSMGGDGAIFIDRKQAMIATPPKVTVKSTVGAGDAMVAGLIYAQQQHLPLEQTAKLATALGTHAVTKVGAGLESPNAHERYLVGVTVGSV
ncbi:1-phosphofructokinase [soil metagenome]